MMPRPPLPDDEPSDTSEVSDLGREDDLERSLGQTERDDATPTAAFTCQGCGATFATRRELHLHNAETHGGGSTGGSTDEPPAGGDSVGS